MLVALAGAGVGLGVVFVLAGVRGAALLPVGRRPGLSGRPDLNGDSRHADGTPAAGPGRRSAGTGSRRDGATRTWVVGAGVGFVVWLLTGWPALGIIVAVGIGIGSKLFGGRAERREWIAKTQAIAAWTEMLRDTMAAADGVEEAISATVAIAPAPIRTEVAMLDARRRTEQPLSEALAAFGEEVDHPSCDLVVASLSAAAQGEGSDFVAVLTRLSTMTRDEVRMRLRVEASRAKIRTSSVIILVVVLVAMMFLFLVGRDFMEPYGTVAGQGVLLLSGGMLAGGLALLNRMSRITMPERFSPRRRGDGALVESGAR